MTGTAEQIAVWLMRQEKSEKLYDIKEHREKRSLTQNSYYWKLSSILAAKLRISTAKLHNLKLRECAPPFIVDDKVAMQPIPDTEEAERQILESTLYHLKPTSGIIVGNDGTTFRWYVVLRGSSTFNTIEMSALLDCLIEDCKEQGIETLPPEELERMRLYELDQERKKAQKNECNKNTHESERAGVGA